MNSELEDLLKENQRLLSDTLRATNRLSQLATAVAENHEERLARLDRLAEHQNDRLGHVEDVLEKLSSVLEESTKHHNARMDRVDSTLDRLASLIQQFVRSPRGNGHAPRRRGHK